MKIAIYRIPKVARNFGLHHHGVERPPTACFNVHLWWFGVGVFFREG